MLQVRLAESRGKANHGWLDSRHSFSFGQYYDPEHNGFGALLVINEDKVQGGQGFATHPHRDMEIISYVLSGALQHQDSIGNGSVLRYGDVQRMSAGSGIWHSEYNHHQHEIVHFLQIWIQPNQHGLTPSYEEKHFPPTAKQGRLALIASADGRDGSLTIHQDADVYAGILQSADHIQMALAQHRKAYVHIIRGQIAVNDVMLKTGDAIKIWQEDEIRLSQADDCELLVFVLPES